MRAHGPMVRMTASAAALSAMLVLAGCGGGGGVSAEVGTGGTGMISGSVTKGPVGNATVTAFALTGGQVGSALGTATTDATGAFTMNIGSYTGAMMLKASGGTYKDEATGQVMPMAAGDIMTAVVPSIVGGTTTTGLQLTPVTAMAQAMAQAMNGGMSPANIAAANAAMGAYFSVSDILHVMPMNPLTPGSGTAASQDARNYGMTLAAMSQYAKSLGLSTSSAMATAMMNDAADGVLDGKAGNTPIQMGAGGMMGGSSMMSGVAGSSGLATAMSSYMNSSANLSGLSAADMAALMQRLSASGGKL